MNLGDDLPAPAIQRCAARPLSTVQLACMQAAQVPRDMEDCNAHHPGAAIVTWDEVGETLAVISQRARVYYEGSGRFPWGDTGVTPGPPICQGGRSKHHPVNESDWSGFLWRDMLFAMLRPFDYSYRYVSDGKSSFTVTAQGDR